jgi:single-stranded-DNA-specific exonuclease
MLPRTKWKLPEKNNTSPVHLSDELGLNPIVVTILSNRLISNSEDVRRFLRPSLKDLHNPFLMKDIDKGVDRLITAISRSERIVVYGDYDADGITSIAVLVKFLRGIQQPVTYYIPDRITEGYGLNRAAIDAIGNDGASLIITVDCGITDTEEVTYAASRGIDTIILDHHEVPDVLPDAVAAINPNRPDCQFPFKHLAGVGIVFNFLIALRGTLRNRGFWTKRPYPNLKEYLDLVALGTIGDISPLVNENRIFAKIGLEIINEGRRKGIKALKEKSGVDLSVVGTQEASFKLIPRINAAGRVGSPKDAVELLLTDDPGEALRLASVLDGYNRDRQHIERAILNEILSHIKARYGEGDIKSIVLASYEWHPGVIGIVASKLVDRYYRPVVLISLKDGVGKGSGRSISEFNLYKGLKDNCDPFLLSYGGHRYAAGISIREENIDAFSSALDNAVLTGLDLVTLSPRTCVDACCTLNQIDHDLIAQIDMLAPFGNMNPEPILCVRNITVTSLATVGNNHLRMVMKDDTAHHRSIWFGMGHLSDRLFNSHVDALCTPQINTWNGMSNIQLRMKDVALSLSSSS